jgi:hypothetical protein
MWSGNIFCFFVVVMQEEWEQKIQFFRFFSCCYDVMQGVGI